MKSIACTLIALQLFCIASIAQVKVGHLLTENLADPIGLDTRQPRFSWQLTAPERGLQQTAYEIKVGTQAGGKDEVWSSGKINSDQSLWVPYAGKTLLSGTRYYWRVRIWDNKGRSSGWSSPAYFQTAFFAPQQEYTAKWISPGVEEATSRPSPVLRKEFTATGQILSATAYITAHGLYEAQLNGRHIGEGCLQPGWTSYHKRLQYQTYDVTGLVHSGQNALGVTLASGWYRGYIGFSGQKDFYGKDISLLLQLVIKYKDGSTATIVSDESWKSSTAEIKSAEIYNGETIDARDEKIGWSLPGYDDKEWSGVRVASFPMNNLVATYNEPVKKQEVFHPQRIFTSPAGEQLVDFGQNLVGHVVLRVSGKAGDRIIVSHAEVLDKAGNFYTENLRSAKASDTFILKGGEKESFEPRFTFHGFRYIRIEGYPGKISPDDLQAVALYSDMPRTGDFHCSNPLINQLQHNIQWGQRGNFLDVPTDCPQRDERLGWTGDAQVFSRTAAYNMGVHNFFSKWLKDVAADQSAAGAVPFVIPNVLGNGASAGWADVGTIIPWNMYLAYGDRRVLEDQYLSMKAWVEYMRAQSKNDLWNTGFHFGDWLFYRPFDDNDGRSAVTDKYLIAQCFYAHSTQLLINAAKVLDKRDDAAVYEQLLKRIKTAFVREYMTTGGRLVSGTQTAYVLALQFDMLPDSLQTQAARRLADNVKDYGYHLTTGFLGTPYLCHVLSRWGYTDIAYRLLMQESYPSWLYPVKMGATTIWERWDGIRPDSTFQTPGMNSFNHYSYGAIGDWMYRTVAGVDTYEDGVAYKHSRIYPHPGGGLTEAEARLATGYGELAAHWRKEKDSLLLDIIIPANTNSTVYIPAPEGGLVTEGGHLLRDVKDVQVAGVGRGYLMLNLGSGHYHFAVKQEDQQPAPEKGK
ncbi:MAG: family 78 glycoside hydrolase catalytic domain [Chitinophagaceae bacterium]|nr:family 78 glycoside hydrolase catalytic domain [Chitinophagaceae bacterium]